MCALQWWLGFAVIRFLMMSNNNNKIDVKAEGINM